MILQFVYVETQVVVVEYWTFFLRNNELFFFL